VITPRRCVSPLDQSLLACSVWLPLLHAVKPRHEAVATISTLRFQSPTCKYFLFMMLLYIFTYFKSIPTKILGLLQVKLIGMNYKPDYPSSLNHG
jgi:hypothetical protein